MIDWYKTPARVLVADDDIDLLNLVGFAFRNAGYETVGVTSGAEALAEVERDLFSLLVLDINMPAPNGLEVCAQIRSRSSVPVLMLSARDSEDDLLQALEAGADAYVTKPFSPRTLIARVQALTRRATADESQSIVSGLYRLDITESQLVHPATNFILTRLEVRVLRLLMSNAGKMVGPAEIIKSVWGSYNSANRNMLKQVVFRLRRKLSSAADVGNPLKTVDGGYVWLDRALETAPNHVLTATAR